MMEESHVAEPRYMKVFAVRPIRVLGTINFHKRGTNSPVVLALYAHALRMVRYTSSLDQTKESSK
jgi:hypothetical protein